MTVRILALTLSLCACGRVYSYPDSEPEHDAATCSDAADNDFDGRADCADTDCDGYCPELTSDECSDQRDNDGDGLSDAADPRCWQLTPPHAESCAETSGIELLETFDFGMSPARYTLFRGAWHWRVWGEDQNLGTMVFVEIVEGRDLVARFVGTVRGSEIAGSNLGAIVRQLPFSGTWRDFSLGFSASVEETSVLRAAIVPLSLAQSASAPAADAEEQLFSLSVDATASPPKLVLFVEGVPYQTDIQCVAAPCTGFAGRVSVALDADGFRARLEGEDGGRTDHFAPKPASSTLAESRLVFFGGALDPARSAVLDDIVLSVKPERRCGFAAPGIGVSECGAPASRGAYGQTVSVARGTDGAYCALIAASAADPEAGPVLPAPEVLTTWHSADGETWTPGASRVAPAVRLPEGAALIGAGIAADDTGFHAAIAYREGGEAKLGFADAGDCDHWDGLVSGPTLFDDAEAPSYVIAGGRHDIFFTRATGEEHRSLWRVTRGREDAPEQLAGLPPEVGAPVSVQKVGSSDLVLTYPEVAEAGNAGIGLLVGGADGRDWQAPTEGPLLEATLRPDLWEGQGRFAFDDRGVIAAALSFDADRGFLLYSGTSNSGRLYGGREQPSLAVGTARFAASGATFPDTALVPSRCGDGICGALETCANCSGDCLCERSLISGETLLQSKSWQFFSAGAVIGSPIYGVHGPSLLNWTVAGEPPIAAGVGQVGPAGEAPATWAKLSLERVLDGDFELSFDWFADWNPVEFGSLSVGLGALEPAQIARGEGPTGIFVELARHDTRCDDVVFVEPLVTSEGASPHESGDGASCEGGQALMSAWRRVVLSRRGSELSLVTVPLDGCASDVRRILLTRPVPELSSLLIGCGGLPFQDCGIISTLANLEVRALPEGQ